MASANVEAKHEVCRYHQEDDGCQLSFPRYRCQGENKCILYQLDAERLCPSCGKKGSDWSGYGEHGGFKYTCWTCEHAWTEPLISRPKTPGVCLRCGRRYDNAIPEVTEPDGRHEIATSEWCAECNAFAVSVLLRWASAYRIKHPHDPIRGGSYART